MREEIEKRWEALKSYVDEEIQSLRESEKVSIQLHSAKPDCVDHGLKLVEMLVRIFFIF